MENTHLFDPATGLPRGSFGIGTYALQGRRFPGLVLPHGDVIDLSSRFRDTHEIFDDWERHFDTLVDVAARPDVAVAALDDLQALPPLAHPNLLCAGANYKTHVAQMMTKNKVYRHLRQPDDTDETFYQRAYAMMEERARIGTPFVWTGLHSSLSGANDDLVLPVLGEQHDWELELGVVLAKGARYVSPERAADLIAGYVMVNDVGSFDIARRTDVQFQFDWISKHQPTFKVAGPFIVPKQFLSWDQLKIRLEVEGQVMQDWPTSDMVFSPLHLLAYLSERIRLVPGDLLLTGSPPGNGAHHGRFLRPGDVMTASITGLGRQRNRCVAEARPDHPLTYGLWKNPTP
jgi:2-keto-4-pentenoate hydratase/2-oxohepta-3-ene-1,7-dioic acid hydratase in catechol pathway